MLEAWELQLRAAVFATLEKHGIGLMCLQETHLMKNTSYLLQSKKYPTQYHSVHSTYSRGVSILVRAGVGFSCRQVSIDEYGRFIFLHCIIDNKMYIIANIYVPPPFRIDIMLRLNEFIMGKEEIPVLVVGDFNEVLDRRVDRFPTPLVPDLMKNSRLGQFLEEVGLLDLWRVRNPGIQQYSCYSSTHNTLSRIDMALGNYLALQMVGKVIYLPRGVSDHSPMVLTLNQGGQKIQRDWKINAHWCELIKKSDEVLPKLKEFVDINEGTSGTGILWDTLKAYLRGVLIQQIAKFNKKARESEEKSRREVLEAENNYVGDPTPKGKKIWLEKQQAYKSVITREVETRRLFLRQSSFAEGEGVGRMLAQVVKSNSSSSGVRSIRLTSGAITSDTSEIVQIFWAYYQKLYTTQKRGMEKEMEDFLERLEIPFISQLEREELENPITLGELQVAVASMANQKSPGPDGLPVEMYKYYGDILLPQLIKTLNGAAVEGKLPASMLEATVIIIPKDGKDPLDPVAYRPISLLCSDAKI